MDVHLRSGRVQLGEVAKPHRSSRGLSPGLGYEPPESGSAEGQKHSLDHRVRVIYGIDAGFFRSLLSKLDHGAIRDAVTDQASFFDMIYFSVVAISTVGFGDITPVTPIARLLVVSEVLVGFSVVVLLVMLFGISIENEVLNDEDD